jgi:hypothetical protein
VAGYYCWQNFTWQREQQAKMQSSADAHNELSCYSIFGEQAEVKKVRTGPTTWQWAVVYVKKGGVR